MHEVGHCSSVEFVFFDECGHPGKGKEEACISLVENYWSLAVQRLVLEQDFRYLRVNGSLRCPRRDEQSRGGVGPGADF
jgi:hypothetical protein